MRDALAHRGPDGKRSVLFGQDGLPLREAATGWGGLAHRRLSILDLSDAGSQPMSNETGDVWIAYNGETYNYRDHRGDLEARGHRFRSTSDTETILHLYEEYGLEGALARMNGMFAFGLWDGAKRRLFLVRDRIGKKPLYYAETQGGVLFASEIKALLASGYVDRSKLDDRALAETAVIGTPLGENTMYAQIRMLPPGHYAVWESGRLTLHRYFANPFETAETETRSLDSWADELEALLVDAVRIRFVSDVPVAMFLSGGIDSSLIAAIAAKKLGRQPHAFCVAFDDAAFDESAHAQKVADLLGLPMTVLHAARHGAELYEQVARHLDQPLGDASAIPTFLLSESARAAGVKVALTGDGGDEMFAGYEEYRNGIKFWGTPEQRRLIRQQRTVKERLWEARVRSRGFVNGYASLQNQFGLKLRLRMYRSPVRALRDDRLAMSRRLSILRRIPHRGVLDRMQHSDMETLLPDVILRKVDMMSMANGLECRSPLLDYRVWEFAARLDFGAKIEGTGRGKLLLRHLLSRFIDPAVFRRPKMGFCIPWERHCTGDFARELSARWRSAAIPRLREDAGEVLFEGPDGAGLFRKWSAFTQVVFFDVQRAGGTPPASLVS